MKISAEEHEHRMRIGDAELALSKAVLDIEKKYQLTVDELAKLLVDRASRILEDGIAIERGQAK
jgi:hypothetical protein